MRVSEEAHTGLPTGTPSGRSRNKWRPPRRRQTGPTETYLGNQCTGVGRCPKPVAERIHLEYGARPTDCMVHCDLVNQSAFPSRISSEKCH